MRTVASTAKRAQRHMKTLVVEDSLMEQCLLAKVLAEHGHEVISFENAEQAVLAYQKQFYPLVFVDAGLPGMDGLQFCRWLRSQPDGEKIYLIVATSSDQPADLGQILAVGANDFLPKPYDQASLQVRLTVAENQMQFFFERQNLEQTAQANQESLERVVRTAREGVWALDADFRTRSVNAQVAEMLGYTVEEMTGRPIAEFLAPSVQERTEAWFQEQRQAELRTELPFRRKDGSECPVLLAGAPVTGADGKFNGALWMLTDLSVRRNLEAELTRNRDESKAHLKEVTTALCEANQELEATAAARKRAEEAALHQAQDELQHQAQQHTQALADAHQALQTEAGERRRTAELLHKAQQDLESKTVQQADKLAQAEQRLHVESAERKREAHSFQKLLDGQRPAAAGLRKP